MIPLRPRPIAFAFAALLAGLAGVVAQSPAPGLTIAFPEPNGYISGSVVLKAQVVPSPPDGTRVAFFLDGHLACQVERPPWECPADVGPTVASHQLRVVATIAGGARLVQTVRTRGLDYTESVDVDAVQVTVVVTDNRGTFARNLPRGAFRVYDNGVPQRITHFASENIPLELTAAVDVSGSMVDTIPRLREAVRQFLGALQPSHKVTLLAFNDVIFTLARASIDPPTRLKAVDRLQAWGGTALYDVVVRAVDMLGRQIGRRALVVFSDGEDTASHITIKTVEDRLQRSDATVYTIAQGQAYRRAELRQILERLAKTTGGRAFATEEANELAESFDEILRELSNQYLLAYVPPDLKRDGSWHQIKVEVVGAGEGLRVRARDGYRAEGGTPVR